MFVRSLLALGMLAHAGSGLLLDTPDANTGGGPAGDAARPTLGGAPDGADPNAGGAGDGADPDRTAADVDDLDDDDDTIDREISDNLPEANVRTLNRRNQRRLRRMQPYADRLRDPRTGQWLPVEELDRRLGQAREFEDIDAVLRSSPRAVQVLMEEQARMQGRGAAPAEERDEPFNEQDWPYETDTPQGQRLLAMAKSQHANEQLLKRVMRRLDQTDQRFEHGSVEQLEGRWKGELKTAVVDVPEEFRQHIVDTVRDKFQLLRANGQLKRVNPTAVINSIVAPFRTKGKKATRDANNRASAMAAGNTRLPQTPRPGAQSPATGKEKTNERETMRHASKGFLAKYR